MEIAFNSKFLRDICENEDTACSELGREAASCLKNRLADLRAATHKIAILAGNPRIEPEEDHLIIDLNDNCRIILIANHTSNPTTEDGRIDWSLVTRIKVMHIGESS